MHPIESLISVTHPDLTTQSFWELKLKMDEVKSKKLIASSYSTNDDGSSDYFDLPEAPGPYWNVLGASSQFLYFTMLTIGSQGTSPPINYILLIDTSSDLTWIQCLPCEECFSQLAPIFDPLQSPKFSVKSCKHYKFCNGHDGGCNERGECTYIAQYYDGSYSLGIIAEDTCRFDEREMSFNIGCGSKNRGNLFNGSDGVLGLGRGRLSFPSHLAFEFGFKKFSYCLIADKSGPTRSASALRFGNYVFDEPNDAVFTPLIYKPESPSIYYINITAIYVGGDSMSEVYKSVSYGMRVDSGTMLTYLPTHIYEFLRDSFRDAALSLGYKSVEAIYSDTCYDMGGYPGGIANAPQVTLYFDGDDEGKLELNPHNVLYNYPWVNENLYCLAFNISADGHAVLGNVQQQGVRVMYDPEGLVIGFDPNSC
ncbi:protein ASPARTIC PROTEASE IN GUARD CELL 2-like [Papaver somniferum]|uniref:protein ASPARTIC PROTEASE IN GUARD CELL 2-like n=1 Tax=Papaver somniferum TaxID=3469 RepID=UPI000E7060A2|nr:protein ASPARTIC PROTEASE IN GUARD CELL 2-like [Papaver somniferum]